MEKHPTVDDLGIARTAFRRGSLVFTLSLPAAFIWFIVGPLDPHNLADTYLGCLGMILNLAVLLTGLLGLVTGLNALARLKEFDGTAPVVRQTKAGLARALLGLLIAFGAFFLFSR